MFLNYILDIAVINIKKQHISAIEELIKICTRVDFLYVRSTERLDTKVIITTAMIFYFVFSQQALR